MIINTNLRYNYIVNITCIIKRVDKIFLKMVNDTISRSVNITNLLLTNDVLKTPLCFANKRCKN